MKGFSVQIGREYVALELLMAQNSNVEEVNRQLQASIVFCGMLNGECIAVCLAEPKSESYELSNWVVAPAYRGKRYGKTLLLYAFDYLKAMGGQSIDMAGSNADVTAFISLQRLGFRIIGVLRNYFKNDSTKAENGIARRDLLRYRFTL